MFPYGFGDMFQFDFQVAGGFKVVSNGCWSPFCKVMALYAAGAFLVSSDAGFGIQVKQPWVSFRPELGFGI